MQDIDLECAPNWAGHRFYMYLSLNPKHFRVERLCTTGEFREISIYSWYVTLIQYLLTLHHGPNSRLVANDVLFDFTSLATNLFLAPLKGLQWCVSCSKLCLTLFTSIFEWILQQTNDHIHLSVFPEMPCDVLLTLVAIHHHCCSQSWYTITMKRGMTLQRLFHTFWLVFLIRFEYIAY